MTALVWAIFALLSANVFSLDKFTILVLVKEVNSHSSHSEKLWWFYIDMFLFDVFQNEPAYKKKKSDGPTDMGKFDSLTHNHTDDFRMFLEKESCITIVGKGENAGNQHFLLFPQCFLPVQREIATSEPQWNLRQQMLLIQTLLNFAVFLRFFQHYLWCHHLTCRHVKILTFCKISVIINSKWLQ